jgi:predicted ArsR family transcriptional regulator
MEYLTVSEMAQTLGIKENAVRSRLHLAKCKPVITNVSLYTVSDLEVIKARCKVGRPKKEGAGD